jgi:cytidylate kinase
MYRAVTYLAVKRNISCEDGPGLARLAAEADFRLVPSGSGKQLIICEGEDITEAIREPLISQNVSLVSSHREVRRELVRKQRAMASGRNVVMDGRDVGTVVLPEAECKIFLTATLEERARRRYEEMVGKGYAGDYDSVKKELARRDGLDENREVDPLRPAPDSVIIDTTGVRQEAVVKHILKICEEKRGKNRGEK